MLDLLKRVCVDKREIDAIGIQRFRENTRGESDISFYQDLLHHAVAGISGKAEEKKVERLFTLDNTSNLRLLLPSLLYWFSFSSSY